MAYTQTEELELIQIHPGTILKVEEGQDCGLLCAVDDVDFSSSARTRTTAAAGPLHKATAASASGRGVSTAPKALPGRRTDIGRPGAASAAAAASTPPGAAMPARKPSQCDNGYDDGYVDEYDECDFGDGNDAAAAAAETGGSAGDDTETFSELSDPGGTEVVFVREGVAVWPGARSERILGRMSLVKQCGVLFMAWLPYSRGVLQPDGTFRVTPAAAAAAAANPGSAAAAEGAAAGRASGRGPAAPVAAAAPQVPSAPNANSEAQRGKGSTATGASGGGGSARGNTEAAAVSSAAEGDLAATGGANDRTLYAVHPIPLSEVKALRRRVPPLGLGWGCPSLVVVLVSGVTLPPLYFHRGGIKALITTLKQHVFLLKSATEPHTYLVNDTADPLSRSLCALQLADVLIGGPPPGASATFQPGEGIVCLPSPPPPESNAGTIGGGAAGSSSRAAAVGDGNSSGGGVSSGGGRSNGSGGARAGGASGAIQWATPAAAAPEQKAPAAVVAAAGSGSRRGNGSGRPGPTAAAAAGIGLGLGLGLGAGVGTAVTWCWMDTPAAAPPPAPTAVARLGGFESMGNSTTTAYGIGDGDSDIDADGGAGGIGGGSGGRVQHAAGAWAYGIVDAINRFVQNVRGTASGWIGALDELDDIDGDLYGSCYTPKGDDEYGDDDAADATYDMEGMPSTSGTAAGRVPYGRGGSTDAPGTCSSGGGDEDMRGRLPGGAAAPAGGTAPHFSSTCISRGRTASSSGASTAAAAASLAAAVAAPLFESTGGGGTAAATIGGVAPGAVASLGCAGDGGAAEIASTEVGDFELLDGGGCWGEAAAHPHGRRRVRPPPLSPEEWAAMFDAEGRLVREAALRDRVCVSGCAPELRREVWKHLLGMYPRGSSAAQRAETAQRWQSEYANLQRQWQSMVPEQEARCTSWRCHRTAVDKDVRRTDRSHPFFSREGGAGLRALRNVLLTHVVYDRDLGYCQGMSDLASPLLVVMRDEAEAFWAFAALMGRLGGNFQSDLQGMNEQLEALRRLVQLLDPPLHSYLERRDCLSYYFAFRWLLIWFKREFRFDDVLSLWEACWACRRTRHLHLYLAAAVLVQHRRVILTSDLDFDGMLRLAIGLAGRLELQPLLETAEALVGYAGEAGREVTAGLP